MINNPTPNSTTPGRSFLSGRGRLVVLGVVIALAVSYLGYAAFSGSTSYYLTVDELEAFDGEKEGRSFRVKGKLEPESFAREEGGNRAAFTLTAGGAELPAMYVGVVPDLFFNPHSDIILQGRYNPHGTFEAETVSVLCPTKYQALEEAQKAEEGAGT
jgi:cytochrome c-type biogenesis protein CcmE